MLIQELLISLLLVASAVGRQFIFKNTLPFTIWVGGQSSIDKNGRPLHPQIDGGGWEMKPHTTVAKTVPENWGGRFWARTGCRFGADGRSQQPCDTGDCGNKLKCDGAGGLTPVTLVEMTLKDKDGKDTYDTSIVDGANVPASMQPVGKTGSGYSCTRSQCSADLNPGCPAQLRVQRGGRTVACYSACEKFQTDQYCCRGAFDSPDRCGSNAYAQYFKRSCPVAYSYAYDDKTSTFTCRDTDYRITFGA